MDEQEQAQEPQEDLARSRYWAAKPKDELATEIVDRVQRYHERMERRGIYRKIRASYRMWFGESADGAMQSSSLGFGGKSGELVLSKTNHYRSLGQHLLVFATSNRPSWDVRAANLDHESQQQAITADSVLEHYMRVERFERAYRDATEIALFAGRGYVRKRWDTGAGRAYDQDPATGKQINEGDCVADVLTPFDVTKDYRRPFEKQDWLICRDFRSKYDLATRYTEHADKLLGADTNGEDRYTFDRDVADEESDDIPVYEFYHRPTESMPSGRLTIVAGSVALYDGALPYDRIPVLAVDPSKQFGTSDGYTPMWDLMGTQELYDAMVSAIASNFDAHAVQNVAYYEGTQIEIGKLAGGGNAWKLRQGDQPPQGINLTKLPAGWENWISILKDDMQKISGINDVARGDPGANVKSGAMAALLLDNVLKFLSGLTTSWHTLIEDGGTMLIGILKRFAANERIAAMVGRDKKYMLGSWSAESIKNVERVVVDSGNPLSKTLAGRQELAKEFLGMKGDQELFRQYVEVITTGKIDPVLDRSRKQTTLIRSENDALAAGPEVIDGPMIGPDGLPVMITGPDGMPILDPMTGQPQPKQLKRVDGVPVAFTEMHPSHIAEHAGVLEDPVARQDPAVIRAVFTHIFDHIETWRTTAPEILQALGIPPLAGPMDAAGPAPESGPGPSEDSGNVAGDVMGEGGADMPRMPRAPVNPATGEPAELQALQASGGLG